MARMLVMTPSFEDVGKAAIATLAKKLLLDRGIDVMIEDRVLFAHHGHGGPLLSGHLDTVPFDATGWTFPQGEIVNGSLYGRGSVDMKGACAAMIEVAGRCVERDVPVRVALTLDEEYGGMRGAAEVAKLIATDPPPITVIGEPTAMVPMMGERGYHYIQVVTRGRTVHSAIHWKGENAIYGMAKVIEALERYSIENGPGCDMNVSPNIIETPKTTQGNMVPEECRLHLDIRFTGELDMGSVESRIKGIIGEDNGLKFSLERPLNDGSPIYSPPARFKMDAPLMRTVESIIGRRFGEAQYTTEATVYSRTLDNIMIWGPGNPMMAHAVDERILSTDIESYTNDLWNLLKRIVDREQPSNEKEGL